MTHADFIMPTNCTPTDAHFLIDDYGNEVVIAVPRRVVVDDFGAVALLTMGPSFDTVDSRWAEAGDSSI